MTRHLTRIHRMSIARATIVEPELRLVRARSRPRPHRLIAARPAIHYASVQPDIRDY